MGKTQVEKGIRVIYTYIEIDELENTHTEVDKCQINWVMAIDFPLWTMDAIQRSARPTVHNAYV